MMGSYKFGRLSTSFRQAWILGIIVLFTFCFGVSDSKAQQHEPVTKNLIGILKKNPEVKHLLKRSIETAKAINPDRSTNPVQSLEEYYKYIDWSVKAMPWKAMPGAERMPSLFDATDQHLNYFYWLIDQPLPELEGKGFYFNSIQYLPELQPWIVEYAQEWGKFLSSEESWNSEYYALVKKEKRFNLDKGWYEDPSNWRTLNDFFSRALSSPEVRPIASPDDHSVVVSPADSEPQGVWKIDENSYIVQKVQVKSSEFQSIPLLLGGDSAYGKIFAGGTFTHTFLNIQDYHRFHFPVSGTIKEARIIPAQDAAGGRALWDKASGKYILESTEPGWQTIETRGVVIIETPSYGHVAVLPVGMSQISSVIFESTVKAGARVKKGDPLGMFLFGGSDIVMIFEKKAGFEITVPAAGPVHEHVLMGQEYGRFRKNAK